MKKQIKRILLIVGMLGSLLFLFRSFDLAFAKDPDYPTKPITVFITMGGGGTTDLAIRAFIEAASKHLGQPFVPINRAGAGGSLAATAVLNAKPDGYTLGNINAGVGFTLPFTELAPYKDLSGFTFIMNFGKLIYPLMVRSDAPWKTWKELIEWAKKIRRV